MNLTQGASECWHCHAPNEVDHTLRFLRQPDLFLRRDRRLLFFCTADVLNTPCMDCMLSFFCYDLWGKLFHLRLRSLDLETGSACGTSQPPNNTATPGTTTTPTWEHTEPEPEPEPVWALANGQYRGARGYTSRGRPKPFSECLSSYHFNVTVNNGRIRFWSDGRTFSGTIDRSGTVTVTRRGISPRTRTPA